VGSCSFAASLLGYECFPDRSAKFPVPYVRECGLKALNLLAYGSGAWPRKALDAEISLYFPETGKSEAETGSPMTATTAISSNYGIAHESYIANALQTFRSGPEPTLAHDRTSRVR
jgi:hypothetical protein